MATGKYNFDDFPERRGTDSIKWNTFAPDVIPMWVADMDFKAPPEVLQAMHERVEHGVFGYAKTSTELLEVLQARYGARHDLSLELNDMAFVPSVISTLYAMVRVASQPGESVLVQHPIYWPFVSAIEAGPRALCSVPMATTTNADGTIHYEVDFDAFEAAITPQTRLFLLSNPHNPVGRVYTRAELERMAEICLRHNIIICSDEIHSEITYPDNQHIPILSLGPEVAQNSVLVTAASKAFNLPGVGLSVAMSKNHALLQELTAHMQNQGLGTVNILNSVAVTAAFRDGQPWLDELLPYLRANRDFAVEFISQHMPGIVTTRPEATCLLLLHTENSAIDGDPTDFFLEQAKVALSGNFASQGYPTISRLNFGCPRALLTEALERMAEALAKQAK